jgi:aldose 1-epimerase
MARFIVEHAGFGKFETIILRDTRSGAEARVACFGANLLSYRVPVKGKLFDVTDGFQTPEELEAGKGGRAWIMAPFSNRIDEGRYTFAGKSYAIPMPDPSRRVVMHGFVRQVPFEVARETPGETSVSLILTTSVIRPGVYEGYPFAVDVSVAFTLSERGLDVKISGRNVGEVAAFFGCGWHPYFRASEDGIEKLRLVIPSKGRIVPGDRLLPLAGAAAFVDMESAPELDFRPNRPQAGNVIAGRVLDGAYRELVADADGLARSYIENPETGLRVSVYQERGLMHIYTGDGVPERKRASVALEPVEFMTNAVNRPECAKDIVLAPGAERGFRFGVEARIIAH